MCFAPLLLVGYLFTVQTAWHQTTTMDAPIIEVQTCETGLALEGKVAASGLLAGGLQYGWQWTACDLSLTAQPKAGFSHALQPVYELPSQTQFQLAFQLLFGYQHARIGVEYIHFSNAGMASPNIGLDLIAVMGGWSF